jgi:ABC-type histidine transport system ATPase subunit
MMKKGVLRTYDLCPDGVQVIVDWGSMSVGTSIFVPCINTPEATRQAKAITAKKDWRIETRVRIEGGKLGVRIWRVL